jgi:hypothetical protein
MDVVICLRGWQGETLSSDATQGFLCGWLVAPGKKYTEKPGKPSLKFMEQDSVHVPA